uniref:DH domain-containing protein n=3 Tax=Photinus pyralis TaxID=7054 RepID=A0A1Y1K702_PHOPY
MSLVSCGVRKRDYGNIRRNRELGEVKSLVLEYENVLSHEKCVSATYKAMGCEISCEKPTLCIANNIVKRRINELNKRQYDTESAPLDRRNTNKFCNRSESLELIQQDEPERLEPTSAQESDQVMTQKCNLQNPILNETIAQPDHRPSGPITQICSEKDEFAEIESKLREMQQTVVEMENNYDEPRYVSRIFHVFDYNTSTETQHYPQEVLDELDGSEIVDIYLDEQNGDLSEDFGEVLKEDLINTDFIEAYNQKGYELLMTSVNVVQDSPMEVTSLSENSNSTKVSHENEDAQNLITSVDKQPEDRMERRRKNAEYFTAEELNALIPDDDDDDEFEELSVEIGNPMTMRDTAAVKSETIYDSFHNPRIAKVTSLLQKIKLAHRRTSKEEQQEKVKSKINYIMEEIVETEKKYINHLECILVDYLPYLRTKKVVPKKSTKIGDAFTAIKEIMKGTMKFYKSLKKSKNYEDIGKVFINFRSLFEMYPGYCRNKKLVDDYLVNFRDVIMQRQRELNDQLGLGSHLLTPIQRLGKYKLFLEQIEKELRRENRTCIYITYAVEIVRTQMATGDLYIAVDSIRGCPIDLLQQGALLLKENFTVLKPKKFDVVLFLFERMLIYATQDAKNVNFFTYRSNIKLDEMGIATCDYEPLLFVLKRFAPNDYSEYTIEAKKNADKKMWTDEIEKLLWNQLVECREKQKNRKPIPHVPLDEVTYRTRTVPNNSHSLPKRSRPRSKFYLDET